MIVRINSYQFFNKLKPTTFTVYMTYTVNIDDSTCCRFNCTIIIRVLCACELLMQLRHLHVHVWTPTCTGLLPRFRP